MAQRPIHIFYLSGLVAFAVLLLGCVAFFGLVVVSSIARTESTVCFGLAIVVLDWAVQAVVLARARGLAADTGLALQFGLTKLVPPSIRIWSVDYEVVLPHPVPTKKRKRRSAG